MLVEREWSSLIPEGKHPITHLDKPGWIGYVHEQPWGLPELRDIQWVFAPEEDGKKPALPHQPRRYPKAVLRAVKY